MPRKKFDDTISFVLSLGVLAFFIVASIVVLVVGAFSTGCVGPPFTTADPEPTATTNNNDNPPDANAPEVEPGPVALEAAATLDATPELDASVDAGPDAFQVCPTAVIVAPPAECTPTVGMTPEAIPSSYIEEERSGSTLIYCDWKTAPTACGCAPTCDCLAAHQLPGKSCSCEIVDSGLAVVACE